MMYAFPALVLAHALAHPIARPPALPALPQQERPAHRAGQLDLRPIEVVSAAGTKLAAESGTFTVREDRSDPGSALIDLALIRLKSTAAHPGNPIVYLHGGPGGSATQEARDPSLVLAWEPMLALGDVILIDQRGAGASRPSLAWQLPESVPADVFHDRASFVRFMIGASRSAAAALRERGIELSAYTTPASADDIDELRAALGVEQLRLLGFSYGTHLGLSVIRRHGEHVESAVLIGVEGPNHTEKLPSTFDTQWRKLARMAATDPGVRDRVPDLVLLLQRVLAKLDRDPLAVTIVDPHTNQPVQVPVGAFGLRFLLMVDLGDRSDFIVFPRLLDSIDRGDATLLRWFVQKRYAQLGSLSALLFTMDAASGATAERRRRIAEEARTSLFADVMVLQFPELDEIWEAPDLGDEFRSPIISDVRTLFVSGTFDNNTPPFNAEEVRYGFARARHLLIEYAGHEDWLGMPRARAIMREFLAGGEPSALEIALPLPRFVPIEGYDRNATHPCVPRP